MKNDCIVNKKQYLLKELPNGQKLTVRDLQLEVLEIMDEIHRVCEKNDIKYCLIAGSALGICNYKGFIPWDDDMDICILKEDWERFIKALETDLSDKFYFHCFENNKKYNVLIPSMKIRKKGTYIEEQNFLLKNRCPGNGIFIDVVIYDSISESKFVEEIYRAPIKLLMPIMVLLDNIHFNPVLLKKIVLKISESYSKKYKDSKLISQQIAIPWEKFLKEPVFLKEDVLPFKLYEFEGRKFYSYNNIENVLTKWYGPNCLKKWDGKKYIEPYPIEKRKPKHIKDININGEGPIDIKAYEEKQRFFKRIKIGLLIILFGLILFSDISFPVIGLGIIIIGISIMLYLK